MLGLRRLKHVGRAPMKPANLLPSARSSSSILASAHETPLCLRMAGRELVVSLGGRSLLWSMSWC